MEAVARKTLNLLSIFGVNRIRLALACGTFAQFLRGSVGESQHSCVEVFIELLGVRNDREIMAFLRRWWSDVQVTLALEDRARDLSVHRSVEGKVATSERKSGRIPAQLQVFHEEYIAARQQTAQLLVGCVAIAGMLRLRQTKAAGKQCSEKQRKCTKAELHRRAPN